LLTVKN